MAAALRTGPWGCALAIACRPQIAVAVSRRTASSALASPMHALRNMGLEGSWRIASPERMLLEQLTGLTTPELMRGLLPAAAALSWSPVSEFRVGAVALGHQGHLYLGTNLEFPGLGINMSVHAEQAAICNLAHAGHGERLRALAVNAMPCGHCRQFLAEAHGGLDLDLHVGDKDTLRLGHLLPQAFLPSDLGNTAPLLAHERTPLKAAGPHQSHFAPHSHGAPSPSETDLRPALLKAVVAAGHAYAPYSHAQAAVALQLRSGQVIEGCYLENAAFNPSLPPAQAAVIMLRVRGHSLSDVHAVVLAEHSPSNRASVSHRDATQHFFHSLVPSASFHYLPLVLNS